MPDPEAGVRRLFELIRRVNSSTDTASVLEEIVHGVVDELGYGVAAIARLEGDTLVMTAVAGPEHVRAQILGRRTPAEQILDEFRQADKWGILRYVPHGRMNEERLEAAWLPDFVPDDAPDAWHPEDALYAPLYSATGELLGNVAVDLPPGNRVPGPEQRELLELFVVQAGLALYNAQMRERLHEQVRLGAAVKEVAQAGSLIGLDAILAAAATATGSGLGARQTWIRCFPDGEQGQLEHVAGHPRSDAVGDDIPTLRGELAAAIEPARGAAVVRIDDTAHEQLPTSLPRLQEELAALSATPCVVAPFGVGHEMLGYICVAFDPDHGELRPPELDAVLEISRELGRIVHSARLFETEQRLVSELREIDRYKGELIATISHELKTPLTSIIGHIELLQDIYSEVGSIEAISRNAQRLNRLVNNLLNYSRVQEQRDNVRRPVDLAAMCEASVEMVAFQAETASVDLELHSQVSPVQVTGDPDELGRVIDNLVGNAVKYTPAGGKVIVEVGRRHDVAEVRVVDTGIGISTQDQAHLFSAFHRSSNPDAQSIPGTGLGLAISRRIIEMHAGEILVDSTLGEGSTFTVRLPTPA